MPDTRPVTAYMTTGDAAGGPPPVTDTLGTVTAATLTVRRIMLELLDARNVCVLACRCVHDVLRYFGVTSRGVAVAVEATLARRKVASVIGIRTGPRYDGTKWNGHLVLDAGGILADPTADQLSLPSGGLIVGPFAAPYPGLPATFTDETGVVVRYTALADTTWQRTAAWQPDRVSRLIVGRAIRVLRDDLAVRPARAVP